MTVIGEAEKQTHQRVVQLFIDKLRYGYLGDLSEGDNQNIREGELERSSSPTLARSRVAPNQHLP